MGYARHQGLMTRWYWYLGTRCQGLNHASTLSNSASSNVESGEWLGLKLESEDLDDGWLNLHVVYFSHLFYMLFVLHWFVDPWWDDPILFQTFSAESKFETTHIDMISLGVAWDALNLIPFPGGQRMPRGLFALGFVTFSAFQFQDLWDDVGETARAYDGHPLAELNPARRGVLLQEWARQMLEQKYPNSNITDADSGTCVNGQRRSRTQAEFDFTMDCKKIEVKSASLHWVERDRGWGFKFQCVKFPHLLPQKASFDVLYLVLFSPKWLHLVEHDMRTGIASNGRSTPVVGHKVQIQGAKGATWHDSVDAILEKICTGGDCSLVARASISDSLISDLCEKHVDYASKFFRGKPFSSMSPKLRGNQIEKLVLRIDQMLHPAGCFSVLCGEFTVSGGKRGQNTASVDWIRDEKRIEAKHGKLSFSPSRQFWMCTFYSIKEGCFDELLLAVYSPKGLDVFKHDGAFGMTTDGRRTEILGKRVRVQAPCGELDPLIALQCIIAKLVGNNCQHIASVVWDDGSVEQEKRLSCIKQDPGRTPLYIRLLIAEIIHHLLGILFASNNSSNKIMCFFSYYVARGRSLQTRARNDWWKLGP